MGRRYSEIIKEVPRERDEALAIPFDLDVRIESKLRDHFSDVLHEPIPERLLALLDKLRSAEIK